MTVDERQEQQPDVDEVTFTHAGLQVTLDATDSELLLVEVCVGSRQSIVLTLDTTQAVVSLLPGYSVHLALADEDGPRALLADAETLTRLLTQKQARQRIRQKERLQ